MTYTYTKAASTRIENVKPADIQNASPSNSSQQKTHIWICLEFPSHSGWQAANLNQDLTQDLT